MGADYKNDKSWKVPRQARFAGRQGPCEWETHGGDVYIWGGVPRMGVPQN